MALFDYLRVPYRQEAVKVDQLRCLPAPHPLRKCQYLRVATSRDNAPVMLWPRTDTGSSLASEMPMRMRRFRLGTSTLHGRLLADNDVREWLEDTGYGWSPDEPLIDFSGNSVGAVWRATDGSVFLPFDPTEVINAFWSEQYLKATSGTAASKAKAGALAVYYRLRPALPRPVQILLRRWYSRIQERRAFPAWPVEDSLHGFMQGMLHRTAEFAQVDVPYISAWPGGRRWALVLTHDVETAGGVELIPVLRDIEIACGHRSAWNFVPERYATDDAVIADLRERGFEIGVHGLYHDGRDLESESMLEQRLPSMRRAAHRWRASGFRSPATQRQWELMRRLPFDHDSSYPDTDPFEPQGGGCCSWLPFFNGSLVELPITLPQDHTLFVILQRDGQLWIDKARQLRDRGGLALMITHPDYVSGAPIAEAYQRFLAHFADDPTVWRALPSQVSAWWRRRADSRLELHEGVWRVLGPAAEEASVAFASATP